MIVLCCIVIGVGATLVARYGRILYVFAAFLIFTGIKMLFQDDKATALNNNPMSRFRKKWFRVTDTLHGNRFFLSLPDGKAGRAVRFMTRFSLRRS